MLSQKYATWLVMVDGGVPWNGPELILAESAVSQDVVGWPTGTIDNEPSKSISKPDVGAAPLLVEATIQRLEKENKMDHATNGSIK